MTSILVSTLSRTYLCLCRAHIMYTFACYPSTRVSENEFRKTKNSASTNCSNLLRPNFNGEHFKKINIKTAITYNNIFLCKITVYLENSRLWNQIWPKERMIKILRNRHCINIFRCGIITSNSCDKFHVIWRIINFRSKFTQKLL